MYSIPSIVILQRDIDLNFPGQMSVDLLIRASALPEFSTTFIHLNDMDNGHNREG